MESTHLRFIDEIEESDPLVRAVEKLNRLEKSWDARDPLALLFVTLSGEKNHERK